MARPSIRTKSKRHRRLRLPGGRVNNHYSRETTNFSRCSMCGKVLAGVPRLSASRIRKISRSQRKPERMYGGTLCSICLRDLLKQAIRSP